MVWREWLKKILMLSLFLLLMLFVKFIVVEIEIEMFVVVEKFVVVDGNEEIVDGDEEIVVVSVDGNRVIKKDSCCWIIICSESTVC